MKVLFTKECRSIRLADKDNRIFDLGDGHYVDISGNEVPPKKDYEFNYHDDFLDDVWSEPWIENEGLEEKLVAESIIEPEYEIDDVFGKYGFKNRAGEFVIEPQYAYANEFTCGLAAVNLNRTWYKTEEGRKYYENHYGYIDAYGKTVIPFAYSEAAPFNKYGVAVVETVNDTLLIDTNGKSIPGTENLSFSRYYDYDHRFFEFTDKAELKSFQDYKEILSGVYDTKERKIILEPSIDSIIELSDDEILVYERPGGEFGKIDFKQHYINSKGEKIYPWLNDKGFSIIDSPNKSLVAAVAVSKYIELTGNPSSYFPINGKKYERIFMYGLYSSKEQFILPMEYEKIFEITDNIFACKRDGTFTVIELDESDY